MKLTLNESEVIAILTALNVRAHNLSGIIEGTLVKDVTPTYLETLEEKREEIRNLYTRVLKLK